jgi:ABC-type amino acid transport substrate-binding protein
MRRLSIAVLAAALLAMSPTPALAGPADTTVQIRSSAELVLATTIEVVVVVSCAPFAFVDPDGNVVAGQGFLQVSANQAETGGQGVFTRPIPCDGNSHTLAVFLSPGPWQLGEALASAFACGFTCDQAVKYIHIN